MQYPAFIRAINLTWPFAKLVVVKASPDYKNTYRLDVVFVAQFSEKIINPEKSLVLSLVSRLIFRHSLLPPHLKILFASVKGGEVGRAPEPALKMSAKGVEMGTKKVGTPFFLPPQYT